MIRCELYFKYSKTLGRPWVILVLATIWTAIFHRFDALGGFYREDGNSTSSIWVYFTTLEGVFYALLEASYMALAIRIPKVLDRSLAWLGTLSFSMYLNHDVVNTFAYKMVVKMGWQFPGFGGGLMFSLLVCTPLVIVMSVATYYLIERPFLSLRRSYAIPQMKAQPGIERSIPALMKDLSPEK